jgi:hypothetical protein
MPRSSLPIAASMAVSAGVVGAAGSRGADVNGLTLNVYSNTGLFGPPSSTSVVNGVSFALPGSAHGGSWSAELIGSIAFPGGFDAGGLFQFSCDFFNTTLGFAWVDGHLVCQDGNAYVNDPATTDNPLPVNLFKDSLLGPRDALPFRAHVYYNSQVTSAAAIDRESLARGGIFNDTNHQCGFHQAGSSESNDWLVASQACAKAGFPVAGAQSGSGNEIWCGTSATPGCPALAPDYPNLQPCPGNHSQTCGDAWALEVINFKTLPGPAAADSVGVAVSWQMLNATASSAASTSRQQEQPVPIPVDRLTPALPAVEAQRDALQRSLAVGWGPWLHRNMLAIVKLPDAAALTTELCHVPSNRCAAVARPDGVRQDSHLPDVRVGLHAFDRSYVQFYFGNGGGGVEANVSVEYTVSGASNSALDLLVTPVECQGRDPHVVAGACDDFEVRVTSGYLWFKSGAVRVPTTRVLLEFPIGNLART